METTIAKISNCKRKLTVTVSNEDAKKDYLTVLRKYRNSISMPGFRKGKTPLVMIENMYKKQIKADYLDEYLPRYYQQAILQLNDESMEENKKDVPLSKGILEDFEWNPGEELKVNFNFDVKPSVELKKFKNLEVEFTPLSVTKEMIDERLSILQQNYAKVLEKESPAGEEDIVYYNIEKYNGKEAEKREEKSYKIGSKIFGEKFDNALLGVKKGDVVKAVIDIPRTKPEEKSVYLNTTIKINIIKKIVLPELNDEFAKDVGDYNSLKELKNEIIKELEGKIKVKNADERVSLILQYIIKENPFELPEYFIKDYVDDIISQEQKKNSDMSQEDLQKMRQAYKQYIEKELKIRYVLDELRKIEKIEVSDEEIDNEIRESARRMNMEIEKYKELYKKQLDRKVIKINLMNEKILKNIESTVKFVPTK